MTRLERSLALLRSVNDERLRSLRGQGSLVGIAEQRLAQHDADARAKVDRRQLTIWDAVAARP